MVSLYNWDCNADEHNVTSLIKSSVTLKTALISNTQFSEQSTHDTMHTERAASVTKLVQKENSSHLATADTGLQKSRAVQLKIQSTRNGTFRTVVTKNSRTHAFTHTHVSFFRSP